jgi:hypothetical protein
MLETNVRSEYSPDPASVYHESLNDKQMALTGECFLEHPLIVCGNCNLSCTCLNTRGLTNICPICFSEAAKVPLINYENSEIERDNQSGLIIKSIVNCQ